MSVKDLQIKLGFTKPDGDFGPFTFKKAKAFFKLSDFRAIHVFAQIAHETGNFKLYVENLKYSTAQSIANTFRHDFDANKDRQINAVELSKAGSFVKKPEALANFVYANQNGNGNEASGDGWKFRGRGALQLTGRANYLAFAKYVNDMSIMDNPDLVATKYAFESAMFFFERNKLWAICDKGLTDDVTTIISKRVNGGTNGLEERIHYVKVMTGYSKAA